ncbi:2-phosphosulfolactate phosphatase [Microbacterium sp. ASV49]|uniref:Probable 2-phosphosulfolactate phosphatase n=1 Tax=Microbacterium candidum TaxID=3041922 RepID=A0ABT7MXK5_9MICO|nr:2-phosphosulfolactate phosphatase [Microbacterium sp. ASV49]MDL9979181.1 2-phosphosulfolactate phosphatase [Microbacterium sp. ASV49]
MHPFDQSRYQVRLEHGADGLSRLAASDIVIVVDVLRFSTTVTDAVARGEAVPWDDAESVNGAPVSRAAAADGSLVLLGCLRNASAVAAAALAEQVRRGARTSIAVIAGGEAGRFAAEDELGAGAIVDALAALGLDHSSPEAAVACEAFRGLRGAVRHLLTASGSGQELIERGLRDDVLNASAIDATDAVPLLRDGVFTRFGL